MLGHCHILCFWLAQAPPVPVQQPSKEQDFDLDALLGDLESFDPLANSATPLENSATPTSPVTSSHIFTPPAPSQLQRDYNAGAQVRYYVTKQVCLCVKMAPPLHL